MIQNFFGAFCMLFGFFVGYFVSFNDRGGGEGGA